MAVRHLLEGAPYDRDFLSPLDSTQSQKIIHRPQFFENYSFHEVAVEIGDFEFYGSHDLPPKICHGEKLAFRGFWNQRAPPPSTCLQDYPVAILTGIESV